MDELHSSVYSDAASSMAAIGMFAPLLESIFWQTFLSLGKMYDASGTPAPRHRRWSRPNDEGFNVWDCKIYFGSKGPSYDVFAGISQLVNATGLGAHVSDADLDRLKALLYYRNYMFHMGFEWPAEKRRAFQDEVDRNCWDKYFSKSMRGDQPWIFYLRGDMIRSLPDYVDGLVLKIGSFAKALPGQILSAASELKA